MERNLDGQIRAWSAQPWTIQVIPTSQYGEPFAYHVAQYHLLSLNALMTKLAQFPRGTKFIWTVPFPRGASEADKIFIEVPKFAADHGLQLERAPAPASGAD